MYELIATALLYFFSVAVPISLVIREGRSGAETWVEC